MRIRAPHHRRVAPAVVMILAIVAAAALAELAPWLGARSSPLAPEQPALIPPAPAQQEQIASPEWSASDTFCTDGNLSTHYASHNLILWAGTNAEGFACVVLQNPDEPESGMGGVANPAQFNRSGTSGGMYTADGWSVSYALLPSNADLREIDIPGYTAVTDYLLLRDGSGGSCTEPMTVPTTDGAPAIQLPLQICRHR